MKQATGNRQPAAERGPEDPGYSVTRRTFLQVVGGAGASLILGSFSSLACASPNLAEGATNGRAGAKTFEPNAFVRIDPNGTITVIVNRSDMGQGIRTGFALLVAEELDADWTKVRVEQAPANTQLYGRMGTGGSSSTMSMQRQLREVGAGARMMLISAAAQMWNVDPSTLKTENGHVIGPNGKSAAYGDLTTTACTLPPPTGEVKLKDPSEFKLLGKGVTRIDNPHVVDGTAMYGIDAKCDNMAYAVISRRPAYGASLKDFDDSATRQVEGVIDVIKCGSGVAIIAKNSWAAIKGRDALKANWDLGPNADLDSAKLRAALIATLTDHPAMPDGAKVVDATYDFPYLAHATMEPMNALADVREDSCTVWVGSQSPDSVQGMAARMLNMPAEKITVNNQLLGGGFGRRSGGDPSAEAIELSRLAKRPVKLLWTREDDMKNDFYRPMAHISMKGAVDTSGNPVGWSSQIRMAGRGGRGRGGGEAEIPYRIPNASQNQGGAASPIPNGAWRSVDHGQVVASNECFIDELAHAAGKDPVAFRLSLIDDARLKKVIQTAVEKSGWGTALPKGHGRGIACFDGYNSRACHVVELHVEGDKIKVDRVTAVIDCGTALNPKSVEAQMQGAISDGLSTALKIEITIEKGQPVQNSWPDYPWLTLDEYPPVDVTIINSGSEIGGMGETGYPSVTPAVANAFFAATGKRVRKFPIRLNEVV